MSPSLALLIPAGIGVNKLITDKDDKQKYIGAGLLGGSLAAGIYKPSRDLINLTGGFVSHSVGTQLTKDIKGLKNLGDFGKRTLGAGVIGSGALGTYYLYNYLKNNKKSKKR